MAIPERDPAPPPSRSATLPPTPHPLAIREACGDWVRWGRTMEEKTFKVRTLPGPLALSAPRPFNVGPGCPLTPSLSTVPTWLPRLLSSLPNSPATLGFFLVCFFLFLFN